MSSITCCPSCATRFRVVADQLRISDGWVRCGRCQEVFDAQASLQPMGEAPKAGLVPVSPGASPSAPPSAARLPLPGLAALTQSAAPQAPLSAGYELPAPVATESSFGLDPAALDTPAADQRQRAEPQWRSDSLPPTEPSASPAGTEPWWTDTAEPEPASDTAPPSAAEQGETAAAPVDEPAEERPDGQAAEIDERDALAGPAETAPEEVAEPEAEPDAEPAAEPLPSFVRQAQRRAWWHQPAVRAVIVALLALLPLLLALQVSLHERHTLVAWKPELQRWLAPLCAAVGCEIRPRQHLQSVSVSGSSFAQTTQPQRYQLGLSIRNQSATAVAMPAVELILTDAQEQILVRKVLTGAQLGAPEALAARSEWSGSVALRTEGLNLPVLGYRLLVFYP